MSFSEHNHLLHKALKNILQGTIWNLIFIQPRAYNIKFLNSTSKKKSERPVTFSLTKIICISKHRHAGSRMKGWHINHLQKGTFPMCPMCSALNFIIEHWKDLAGYSSAFGKFQAISLIKWLHFHGTNKLKNIYLREQALRVFLLLYSHLDMKSWHQVILYKYCENNQEALLTLPHSLIRTLKVLSRIKW